MRESGSKAVLQYETFLWAFISFSFISDVLVSVCLFFVATTAWFKV